MREFKFLLVGLLAVALFAGCQPKTTSTSPEDTPPVHYLKGMQMVDKGKIMEAKVHFDRAVELDDGFAPGYAGQALLGALAAKDVEDAKARKKAVDMFRSILFRADKKASKAKRSAVEQFVVDVTAIRCETMAKGDRWLHRAELRYDSGRKLEGIGKDDLTYYGDVEALPFYMAKAWYEAGEYGEATKMLALVTQAHVSVWDQPAADLFARIHKIERAMASYTVSGVSKIIAAKESVSRADVAALIVAELDPNTLFRKIDTIQPAAEFVPTDVVDNEYRAQIVELIKWNIRGLEPVYDRLTQAKLFKPTEPVTRKVMALALEDILIKVTGDESLATKFFGQDVSPYSDVKPTSAYYSAVVNCVTRNLMETDMSGTFRPDDVLDGAELLLAVVRLRNAVNGK